MSAPTPAAPSASQPSPGTPVGSPLARAAIAVAGVSVLIAIGQSVFATLLPLVAQSLALSVSSLGAMLAAIGLVSGLIALVGLVLGWISLARPEPARALAGAAVGIGAAHVLTLIASFAAQFAVAFV
ncbi:hypothetical protein [Homoserinibacter sp. YIM 151385]|uniref:hypothetical protein n=1 Tax=Homoserinibacter sp. YIM 151385 TaxID=2985506 RepID=UPI0022EFDDED|nr:hypothetical protein [Homoserinibacter sp. YIM 151385]WBU39274.1 hypothetical protein OF852_06780 [Homoserinibacter sp. YIM 151385]